MCQTQSPKNTVSSPLSDTSMQSSWSRISTLGCVGIQGVLHQFGQRDVLTTAQTFALLPQQFRWGETPRYRSHWPDAESECVVEVYRPTTGPI